MEIMKKLSPYLERIISTFKDREDVLENVCRVWRYSLRFASLSFEPLLVPLLKVMCSYQRSPHSCYIYIASITVDIFGHLKKYDTLFGELFVAFSMPTLTILKAKKWYATENDIADDYFSFVCRFFTRCPSIVSRMSFLPQIFDCMTRALSTNGQRVLDSVEACCVAFFKAATQGSQKSHLIKMFTTEHVGDSFAFELIMLLTSAKNGYRLGGIIKAFLRLPKDVLKLCLSIAMKRSFAWESSFSSKDAAVLKDALYAGLLAGKACLIMFRHFRDLLHENKLVAASFSEYVRDKITSKTADSDEYSNEPENESADSSSNSRSPSPTIADDSIIMDL
eukprot:TRINITY_DN556_c1_g2_i1.p1 TRINITY_DN556_c1_g2~~TRINITY_DN556_c1_g2_i1.p1  ORF type:complete len:336 (-),score=44.77 TRINITY_DN556_c1_g2_i1:137-1144(-)